MKRILLATVATGCFGTVALAAPIEFGVPTAVAIATWGVNTHLNYTDGYGHYGDAALVAADLAYLGLSQVRDVLPAPYDGGYQTELSSIGTLSREGVRFDLVFRDWQQGITYDRNQFDIVEGDAPGSVVAIEGLNELNNENPEPTTAQAQSFQCAIYALTQNSGDPGAQGLQTYSFTNDATIPLNQCSQPNAHTYPYGGQTVFPRMESEFSNDFSGYVPPSFLATSPFINPAFYPVITESGDYVEPDGQARTDATYTSSVDANEQAVQTLDILFDGLAVGTSHTYLYQLLDNYPDPDDNADDQEYGLFDPNNTPSLAATAVHNVTTLLSGGESTYANEPDCLEYSLSNAPAGTKTLLLQHAPGGHYDLILWNEPIDWNRPAHTPIAVPTSYVGVTFRYPVNGSAYDPLVGTNAIGSGGGTSFSIPLTDHPLLFRVTTSNPNDTACN